MSLSLFRKSLGRRQGAGRAWRRSARLGVEAFEPRLLLSSNPITDYHPDGRSDIAFHRPGGPWTTVPVLKSQFLPTSSGGVTGNWTSSNNGAPSWANQPGVIALPGDYDGDGDTDIAFHRPGGPWNTVPVLFATGGGTWSEKNLSAPPWANRSGVVARHGRLRP